MTDSNAPAPQHAEPQDNRGRSSRYIAIVVAAVLAAALLVYALTRQGETAVQQDPIMSFSMIESEASPEVESAEPTPVESTSAAATTVAASPSMVASPSAAASTDSAATAECTAVDEGFVPNRYEIDEVGADARVVSLGLDSKGNIAAPPLNEPATASWWNQGPEPGSDRGKAVLSIHTYRNGGAVGNDLFEGGASQLEPGDIIKVHGKNGQVQCYEFTSVKKVFVDDYDPNSTDMVDFNGKPQLLIIVCWDFDWDTEIWESRAFFYADPITP